jgi:hypothetical protein
MARGDRRLALDRPLACSLVPRSGPASGPPPPPPVSVARIKVIGTRFINNANQGWLGSGQDLEVSDSYFYNNGYTNTMFNHSVYLGSPSAAPRVHRAARVCHRASVPGQSQRWCLGWRCWCCAPPTVRGGRCPNRIRPGCPICKEPPLDGGSATDGGDAAICLPVVCPMIACLAGTVLSPTGQCGCPVCGPVLQAN